MNKPTKEDEIISNLLKACVTLMDEVVQKSATNWEIVNDAMVVGERYLKSRKARMKREAADD